MTSRQSGLNRSEEAFRFCRIHQIGDRQIATAVVGVGGKRGPIEHRLFHVGVRQYSEQAIGNSARNCQDKIRSIAELRPGEFRLRWGRRNHADGAVQRKVYRVPDKSGIERRQCHGGEGARIAREAEQLERVARLEWIVERVHN